MLYTCLLILDLKWEHLIINVKEETATFFKKAYTKNNIQSVTVLLRTSKSCSFLLQNIDVTIPHNC